MALSLLCDVVGIARWSVFVKRIRPVRRPEFEGDPLQVNNEAVAPATLRSPTRLRAEHDLVELVDAARNGDAGGWNELIRRYTPLVDSVCRDHRLSQADAEDVRQVVWVQLFQNLGGLRETRALPGWLRTTTKREALRVIAARRRIQPVDPSVLVMLDRQSPDEGVDRNLLRSERAEAVWDGLAELSPEHRRLLVLLHAESRPSYQAASIASRSRILSGSSPIT